MRVWVRLSSTSEFVASVTLRITLQLTERRRIRKPDVCSLVWVLSYEHSRPHPGEMANEHRTNDAQQWIAKTLKIHAKLETTNCVRMEVGSCVVYFSDAHNQLNYLISMWIVSRDIGIQFTLFLVLVNTNTCTKSPPLCRSFCTPAIRVKFSRNIYSCENWNTKHIRKQTHAFADLFAPYDFTTTRPHVLTEKILMGTTRTSTGLMSHLSIHTYTGRKYGKKSRSHRKTMTMFGNVFSLMFCIFCSFRTFFTLQ